MENNEPKDKYALVTGAAKGIGKASALELAKLGSNVVINYNSSHEEAEKTVHEIKKLGVKSMSVQADVGNLDQVNFMIKKINDELGQINILVNNAGIIDDGLMLRMSDEAWERVINTNLNGTFYCTRAVLRSMVRERWGRIINIGSVSSTHLTLPTTPYV